MPPHTASLLIRPALPDETDALTAIALEAKAHWGYDDDFMERCREELTITLAKMGRYRIRVAQVGREIAGFSAMNAEGDAADVEDLFVSPRFMGQGIAHRLMEDMLNHARRHGIRLVHVEADPNATGFYEREGFSLCGEAPSGSIPGRKLPVLELSF